MADPVHKSEHVLIGEHGETIGVAQPNHSATFTPVLSATTTHPTLGTGVETMGRYFIVPLTDDYIDLCYLTAGIQFGTSGAAAGSGTYFLEIPPALDPEIYREADVGLMPLEGWWRASDSSAAAGSKIAHGPCYLTALFNGLAQTANTLGTAVMSLSGSTADTVTNAAPWTWANTDELWISLVFTVQRRSSSYPTV